MRKKNSPLENSSRWSMSGRGGKGGLLLVWSLELSLICRVVHRRCCIFSSDAAAAFFPSPLQMMAIFFLQIHFLPIRYQHNHNIWHLSRPRCCCCCCSFWPTSLTLRTISLAGPRATHHILSMLAAAAATGQRSNNNNRAKWGMKKKWNSLNVHKWKKEAFGSGAGGLRREREFERLCDGRTTRDEKKKYEEKIRVYSNL